MKLKVAGVYGFPFLCATLFSVFGVVSAQAQVQPAKETSVAATPVFEVATIKPFHPGPGSHAGFVSRPGGKVEVGAATIKVLI